jgi:hypothetical protein
MKYVLTLGILFKKYKKPLKVTVESKQYIDSFEIDDDIEEATGHAIASSHDIQNKRLWKQALFNRGVYPWACVPKKFFFFEIDANALGKRLILNIDCEDNNHTNSFMTETSLCKVRMVSLIPKDLLRHYFACEGEHRFYKRVYARSLDGVIKTRYDDHNIWPYQRRNWCWNVDNDVDLENQKDDLAVGYLGGKFDVSIPVISKFGVKMFDPYLGKRHGLIKSNFFAYKDIFEKYYKLNMLNEDQRSNNS